MNSIRNYCRCQIDFIGENCPRCGKPSISLWIRREREILIRNYVRKKLKKSLASKRRDLEDLLGVPHGAMKEVSEAFIEEAYYKTFGVKDYDKTRDNI